MFGHNDDHNDQDQDNTAPAVEPTASGSLDTDGPAGVASGDTGPAPLADTSGSSADAPADPIPEQPEEPSSLPAPEPDEQPTSTPTPVSGAPATAETDDLLDIKKDALGELAPLVDHLDQTPEERFKTTMMMIQATDASGLIQNAYDAAKEITDEKARAQALLDIVNEINYFTHAGNSPTTPEKSEEE